MAKLRREREQIMTARQQQEDSKLRSGGPASAASKLSKSQKKRLKAKLKKQHPQAADSAAATASPEDELDVRSLASSPLLSYSIVLSTSSNCITHAQAEVESKMPTPEKSPSPAPSPAPLAVAAAAASSSPDSATPTPSRSPPPSISSLEGSLSRLVIDDAKNAAATAAASSGFGSGRVKYAPLPSTPVENEEMFVPDKEMYDPFFFGFFFASSWLCVCCCFVVVGFGFD